MLFRTVASAFFLEVGENDDLVTLVVRAGMTEIAPLDEQSRVALGFHEPEREVLGGQWGAFGSTWAIVDACEGLRCLQLYSSYTRYLDVVRSVRSVRDYDQDNDPRLNLVVTFRDACQSLRPRAAILDTKPHDEDEAWDEKQGSRTLILPLAPLVAANDADALAGKFFSLLYLSAELARHFTPDPPWYDRDMIILPTGRLIFAGSGLGRMA